MLHVLKVLLVTLELTDWIDDMIFTVILVLCIKSLIEGSFLNTSQALLQLAQGCSFLVVVVVVDVGQDNKKERQSMYTYTLNE